MQNTIKNLEDFQLPNCQFDTLEENIVFSSQDNMQSRRKTYQQDNQSFNKAMQLQSQCNADLPHNKKSSDQGILVEDLKIPELKICDNNLVENGSIIVADNFNIFKSNFHLPKYLRIPFAKINDQDKQENCIKNDDISITQQNLKVPCPSYDDKVHGNSSQEMIISSQESTYTMDTLSQETVVMSSLDDTNVEEGNDVKSSLKVIEMLKGDCNVSAQKCKGLKSAKSVAFDTKILAVKNSQKIALPGISDSVTLEMEKTSSQSSINSQKMSISSQGTLSSQNMEVSSQESESKRRDEISLYCGTQNHPTAKKRHLSGERLEPPKKLRRRYLQKKKRLLKLQNREKFLKEKEIALEIREQEIAKREAAILTRENSLKEREKRILNYEAVLFRN